MHPDRHRQYEIAIKNTIIDVLDINYTISYISLMITSAQMRGARAMLGIDQRQLAELSGVSLPTIQRMESSDGNVRGLVDSLTKVVEALDRAGIELIGDDVPSLSGGRGIRLKQSARREA